MAPRFKTGDFNCGIEQGIDAVIAQLSGDDTLPPDDVASQTQKPFIQTPDMSIAAGKAMDLNEVNSTAFMKIARSGILNLDICIYVH